MTPDPARRASWIALLLVAGGFALLGWTWRASALLVNVHEQLPYTVSGGLVALGLIGAGAAILNVQASRVLDAEGRADVDAASEAALELLDALRRSGERR